MRCPVCLCARRVVSARSDPVACGSHTESPNYTPHVTLHAERSDSTSISRYCSILRSCSLGCALGSHEPPSELGWSVHKWSCRPVEAAAAVPHLAWVGVGVGFILTYLLISCIALRTMSRAYIPYTPPRSSRAHAYSTVSHTVHTEDTVHHTVHLRSTSPTYSPYIIVHHSTS